MRVNCDNFIKSELPPIKEMYDPHLSDLTLYVCLELNAGIKINFSYVGVIDKIEIHFS
jgi:hypothetical protein